MDHFPRDTPAAGIHAALRAAPASPTKASFIGPQLDAVGLSVDCSGPRLWDGCRPLGGQLVGSDARRLGYTHVYRIISPGRRQIGTFRHSGPGTARAHIEITGPEAPAWLSRIKTLVAGIRITRMDVAYDCPDVGSYAYLEEQLKLVKSRFKVYGYRHGDGEDHPDDGVTYYLGKAGRAVVVRLYERGKHPDHRHYIRNPHLTRLELQLRPRGHAAQTAAANWDLVTAWGARNWTRAIAASLLDVDAAPIVIQPSGRPTDDDKVIWSSIRQSGKRFARVAKEMGGWDKLGLALGEIYGEQQALARKGRL